MTSSENRKKQNSLPAHITDKFQKAKSGSHNKFHTSHSISNKLVVCKSQFISLQTKNIQLLYYPYNSPINRRLYFIWKGSRSERKKEKLLCQISNSAFENIIKFVSISNQKRKAWWIKMEIWSSVNFHKIYHTEKTTTTTTTTPDKQFKWFQIKAIEEQIVDPSQYKVEQIPWWFSVLVGDFLKYLMSVCHVLDAWISWVISVWMMYLLWIHPQVNEDVKPVIRLQSNIVLILADYELLIEM